MKVLSPAVAYLHWAVKISKSASYILCRQNIAFKTPNVFKKYGNVTRKGKTWPYSNIKINDSRFLWPQGDRDHVIKAKSVVRVHTINIGSWLGDTRWMTGFHNDNGWDSPVDIGARIVTAVLAADIITLLFIIHGRVRREHSSPCHVCGQNYIQTVTRSSASTYLRPPCCPGCWWSARMSCWGRCRTWWRGRRGRGAGRTPPRSRISYLKQNIYQDYHHYHHLHSWESITWRD